MIVIPAIDLLGGRCVRLLRGEYDKVTEYSEDPLEVARRWEQGGAKRIHVVDLDGARTGQAVNQEMILRIAAAVKVPIEVGGGIRSIDQVQTYLTNGVDRVIFGTVAFSQPDLLESAASIYPGQVWVGIDGKKGRVAVEGWIRETDLDVYELAELSEQKGAGGVIFTDIARDGALVGPNLESLQEMSTRTRLPLIASGGISTLEDLRALRGLDLPRIEGCIIGKALYAGAFTLPEAIEALEG